MGFFMGYQFLPGFSFMTRKCREIRSSSLLLQHLGGICVVLLLVFCSQNGHCQNTSIPPVAAAAAAANASSSSYSDNNQTSHGNPSFPHLAWPPLMPFTSAHMLQAQSNSTYRNDTYNVLVPRNRIDPLNHFRRYKGGYDIKNKHYWASTIFTGVHGYAIGAAWLLIGILYAIALALKWCCCNGLRKSKICIKKSFHSKRYYVVPFLGVLVITAAVIVASAFVLSGNSVFHRRAKRVERTIVGAADRATNTISNVTSTIKLMQDYLQPYDSHAYERLNSTASRLDSEAQNIHDKVYDNKHAIDLGLKLLYIVTAVIPSVNLALAIFVVGVLLLHWRKTFFSIIILCWLLTTIIWLGFGFYFAIHKFADDSCIALSEYQRNPYSNTTLESILPCVDLQEAESSLTESRQAVHVLIGELNRNISRFSRLLNGSIKIPHICDPFTGAPDYQYKPDACPNDTIQIGNLTDVLKSFLCPGNSTSQCGSVQVSSEVTLDEAKAYTKAIQSLINIFPQLQSLVNCSFVKDTFSTIVSEQCSPLKSSVNTVWISMAVLASLMVILVISWIAKAYQNVGRHFLKGSVIPLETSAPNSSQLQNSTSLQPLQFNATEV